MYELVIQPLNHYDNGMFFNNWMKENYPEAIGETPYPDDDIIIVTFEEEPILAVKTAITSFYQAISEADVIGVYQEQREAEINDNTDYLIIKGVDFDGHHFSLSKEAQLNWIGIPTAVNAMKNVIEYDNPSNTNQQNYEAAQNIYFPMPVSASQNDASTEYWFATYKDFMNFYNSALVRKKLILDQGRAIIEDIWTKTTITDVKNVVDTRMET